MTKKQLQLQPAGGILDHFTSRHCDYVKAPLSCRISLSCGEFLEMGNLFVKSWKKEDTSPPATRKSQHLTSQEPAPTSSSHGFARALGQAVDGGNGLKMLPIIPFFACKQTTLVLWFVSGIEHIIIHMICFWIVFAFCKQPQRKRVIPLSCMWFL